MSSGAVSGGDSSGAAAAAPQHLGGHAQGAFERLRSNVERYVFPKVGQVSVSVGMAELRSGDTPTACFERADKALYFAKQHGRNQVQDFTALVTQGHLVEESRDSDVELF